MPSLIRLIRHGQSTFNAIYDETEIDPMHPDARLSEIGHAQVAAARARLTQQEFDVVLLSPLTRAIQTALGLFGLDQNFEVGALPREWLNASCDIGRAPEQLAAEFPTLTFDHLDDPWWYVDPSYDGPTFACEPEDSYRRRVQRFANHLRARPEQRIAVVGHGDFFHGMIGRYLDNCAWADWDFTLTLADGDE